MAHLTKKHFIKIANIFRKLKDEDGDIIPAMDYLDNRVIPTFIDMLEDSNDLFNRGRFIAYINGDKTYKERF